MPTDEKVSLFEFAAMAHQQIDEFVRQDAQEPPQRTLDEWGMAFALWSNAKAGGGAIPEDKLRELVGDPEVEQIRHLHGDRSILLVPDDVKAAFGDLGTDPDNGGICGMVVMFVLAPKSRDSGVGYITHLYGGMLAEEKLYLAERLRLEALVQMGVAACPGCGEFHKRDEDPEEPKGGR